MTTEEQLAALFRKLGARNPEAWARSQIKEGIPQLLRFLFLREAWKHIVPDRDHSWMEAHVRSAQERPNDPYSGVGQAIGRCLDAGIDKDDLGDIVRGAQAELLFSLCYLLEDPNLQEPEVENSSWALFEIDPDGRPRRHISGLHESVLETDPTGREMRPRRNRA